MAQIHEELGQAEVNPVQAVLNLAGAYAIPRCLHVVADLGVADVLDETPRTAADLARGVKADPDALRRVLRLLAAHGIFVIQGDAFAHSPASRLLRTDHPHSMRAFVRMFGLRAFWDTQGALLHSVRTGRVAAEEALPQGWYGYLAADPNASAIFNAAMAGKAHGQLAGVLAAYDFSVFHMIGDIGGGRGHLLRAILNAVPTAHGVLFDLPRVIDEARPLASTERIRLQPGDFFKDALPACDGYVVMEVIHAFGDADAVKILRAIRQAAPPQATLLVIEQMIPDDPGPHWAKTLDIHMLALLGGRQRSREEYAALLARAGFAFKREIGTRAGVAILESVAV
jgi:hypothetical protein